MSNYTRLFRLHTNEGYSYVYSAPEQLRERMYRYIRDKRKKGLRLAEIVFCWSEIRASRF